MKLYLLGTGAAVSDPHRTTTMLAMQAEGPDGRASTLVVDCGGDVVQRMMACGLDPLTLDALVVTHEHPDHVSGFPLFMEKMWLCGRREPIPVHGIAPALSQARRIWEAFDTAGWVAKGLPEIAWHEVEYEPDAEVLESPTWRVTAAPGAHAVPCVGLRVKHVPTGRALAYSCDTAPTPPITALARGADLLVHEATGTMPGNHSSAEEAAEVAAKAGVHRLLLVHLSPGMTDADLEPARQWFTQVELGEELGVYEV